jgi:deoxyribose-phosphate aldolase
MNDQSKDESDVARRALQCLDLTELADTCSEHAIDTLITKALDPRGPVAAVCVWPQFVSRVSAGLRGSAVRVATVANFPAGESEIDRVIDDIGEALGDGAQEIDLVLPYKAFRAGDGDTGAEMVNAVRDIVDLGRLL